MLVTFAPEGKSVTFDLHWLETHAYDRDALRSRVWLPPGSEIWDARLMDAVPVGDFQPLSQDGTALCHWLALVNRYGFGKVVNGPVESGALFRIVDLFGYVRETKYGRHFDVRTDVNPTNLAYTGLGLQAHTDNPYRDPVPTVQVLYSLESSAAGGDNMVVDGFAAALRLREENEACFDVLADYCARFDYAGEKDVCLTARRPLIELSPDGELLVLRFNNRSLAAVTDVPFEKMSTWYAACRLFGEILDDPAMEAVIVATLLHDIGHFTSEFGTFTMHDTEDRCHEDAGAEVLERCFPRVITDCVRYHVAAKRYLCAARPDYFQRLSEASIHSLNKMPLRRMVAQVPGGSVESRRQKRSMAEAEYRWYRSSDRPLSAPTPARREHHAVSRGDQLDVLD